MNRLMIDRVIFLLTAAIAAATAVGFGIATTNPMAPAPDISAALMDGRRNYEPVSSDAPHSASSDWPAPVGQSRGPAWVYEIFTPPEIDYDRESGEFAVRTSKPIAAVVAMEPELGSLKLLQVRRRLLPIQLLGASRGASRVIGLFDGADGEVCAAGPNEKIGESEFVLSSIDFAENGTVEARVKDARGNELMLVAGRPAFSEALIALIEWSAHGGELKRTVEAGDAVELDGVSYEIEAIAPDPSPSITLIRHEGTKLMRHELRSVATGEGAEKTFP